MARGHCGRVVAEVEVHAMVRRFAHAIERQRLSFEAWMREVDLTVVRRTDVSVYDLPDCCFRVWYEGGMSARVAAIEAIANAKE